ncbi:MAG TPA: 23S rRNA (adenine(2503)-C(2))-methyltransferase RlmN [candidate division Zixibacteria bacterium]|nr:23S rRNA (adenine(2503)-C(2))-methyltransferase RlmN [candidate division Zixibacteria bacterium]
MTELPLAGPRPAISEVDPATLAAWLDARGEPAYRAEQIVAGVHRPEVTSFADLTDLPRRLRRELEAAYRFSTIVASHVLTADNGLTAKAVHELHDGQRIESVLMRYPRRDGGERTTICISSQAGCAVNCPFCATGQAGFGRQLAPGEIVDQVLHWHRAPWQALGPEWRPGQRTGHYNIVFMGMGEPLNNADRVFAAVRLLNDPRRLGIGARHITVSTSGVVPGIDRMIAELPQVNLAISLHAADDELRDELVPLNRKWPLAQLLAAGRRYADATGRRVSLEYVMIDGVNDTLPLAEALAGLARGWRSHVNLIPLNPTPGSRWSGTPPRRVAAFADVLRAADVAVTVRDTRGREIEAACGQLHAQLAGKVLPRPARERAAASVQPSARGALVRS